MKGGLEIIIRADGFDLTCHRGSVVEELRGDSLDIGALLTDFCERHSVGVRMLNLFLAEEMVYMTSVDLPLKTANLSEAISFQMGMLVPFSEDDYLSSYTVTRREGSFRVVISASAAERAVLVVEELVEAGFIVKGLYPESQRYVTAGAKKARWALVMPGNKAKVLVFDGGSLVERVLCNNEDLSRSGVASLCETESVFHLSPPIGGGYNPARQLMADRPLLKDFNLLPASFRRPDYLKMAILALLGLNIFALLLFGGYRYIEAGRMIEAAESEIAELTPLVRKVNEAKKQIDGVVAFLDQAARIGKNPDVITFMDKLTGALPGGSYLDQLKFDAKKNIMTIYGYTDDVSELTTKLQEVGESRLKSTSRRRNMTYFQVEMVLLWIILFVFSAALSGKPC
ncbi:MAG: hypothetical protein ABFQ82_01300 [Thermodesulfobacteriota bacterium]